MPIPRSRYAPAGAFESRLKRCVLNETRLTMKNSIANAEKLRLEEDRLGHQPWRKWGPYLSERQWGTVREDYGPGNTTWEYFPHDHARSRAFRWGEDGIAGIS